jgi:hypothetical protein
MITLIFGVPGSGKTYWMVHTIKRKALTESDIFFRVRDDTILITNIKLRLDDNTNYIFVENWEDWFQFFSVNFWNRNLSWWQGKRIFIVMDECQRFFMLAKDNPEVWFYLQYHRHFGTHTLIFATQTPKSIPAKLYEICEYVIEAVPKSVNIFSLAGFRYRVLNPLDKSLVLRRFHLPYDPVTFYLYSDMVFKEDEEMRPQNAFLRPVAIMGLTFLGVLISLHLFFSGFGSKIQPSQTQTNTNTRTVQTQPITYEDLTYEDLIKEELQEIKEEPQEPQEPPKPKEEPVSYYHITVERTRAKTEGIELSTGPKIIYLP